MSYSDGNKHVVLCAWQEAGEDIWGGLQVRGPVTGFGLTRRPCETHEYSWVSWVQRPPTSTPHYLGEEILRHGVLVCGGYHIKVPQTGWSKQQKFILSPFRRLKTQDQGISRLCFSWGLSPWPSYCVLRRSFLCVRSWCLNFLLRRIWLRSD